MAPQQVPLKLLFPIIENASVEESDELQDRWANLLAHAADPGEAYAVSVSFPTILRELSARQVKFLDALYDHALHLAEQRRERGAERISFTSLDFLSIFSDAGLFRYTTRHQHLSSAEWDREDVQADRKERGPAIDMFLRHRIMEEVYDLSSKRYEARPDAPELDSALQFTLLGAQFVAACREPKPSGVIEARE